MASKHPSRRPSIEFHMKTRASARKTASDPTSSSPASSTPSPAASTQPSTPPEMETRTSRKRKASESSPEGCEAPRNAKRPAIAMDEIESPNQKSPDSSPNDSEISPKAKSQSLSKPRENAGQQPATTFAEYKDKELWPEFDAQNPIFYANDGVTKFNPGEIGDTPESRSPRKPARGGGRGGRGGHGNGSGRGRGRHKGKGGRGGDSPEPPNRKRPLTQDERVEISMLKARQQELKRFFSVVGAQQVDILEQLSSRDLSKIARKPKAHKHFPEYTTVTESLDATMADIQSMVRDRYNVQLEHEMQRLEQDKEVIEQQFRTHVAEARKEHLAGAEGDIILFERAYRAAHDDTHTESGSDLDYFPHYHELPEADTQPRGYVSRKIMDEKPFKLQLASYDEQARQEVLNEDIIGPLLKQMEQRNNEWREEQIRKKSQNMDALSAEAVKELELIRGYLVPRPMMMHDTSSYALSALADVSEWMAQQHPERQYIYMPLGQGETFPRQGLDFSPLPGQQQPPPHPPRPASTIQNQPFQIVRPESRDRRFKYPSASTSSALPLQLPPLALPPPPPAAASTTTPTELPPTAPPFLARIMSNGPGQPIAPAPPKPMTRSSTGPNMFRHHNTHLGSRSHGHTPPPASPAASSSAVAAPAQSAPTTPPPPTTNNGPSQQQFIFQPPQQPFQHQSAPGPTPTPQYGPTGAGPVGQQTKIPMTFVNQTIASRNAAAAASASASASASPAGSQGHGGQGVPAAGNGTGPSGAGNVKGGQRVLLPKM